MFLLLSMKKLIIKKVTSLSEKKNNKKESSQRRCLMINSNRFSPISITKTSQKSFFNSQKTIFSLTNVHLHFAYVLESNTVFV
jgi:hypothetical protein